MKRLYYLFYCVLISELASAKKDYGGFFETERYISHTQNTANLYEELFTKRHYNRLITPVYEVANKNLTDDAPPTFEVFFTIDYVQIFGLDAQSQLLSLCMQIRKSWTDPRLKWDPLDFGRIEQIRVIADALWIPNSQFGSVKILDDMVPATTKTVKITSDGTVEIDTSYYMEIACQINVNNFPFDNQTCQMPIISYSYDGDSLTTNGTVDPRVLQMATDDSQPDIGNGEWQCTGIDQKSFNYGQRQLLRFFIHLKRVPNYYIYVIALPCLAITFLTIFGMFWNENNQSKQLERLMIGLTSFVSMTVLLDLLSTSIPKTSVFPLLGIYLIVCVGIISVSCFFIILTTVNERKRSPPSETKSKSEELLNRREKLWKIGKATFLRPHICLQIILHIANFTNFIVFMSFWK